MQIAKIQEGVLEVSSQHNFHVLDDGLVETLINEARSTKLLRARINFHHQDSKVHEMIICLLCDTKVFVHRHHNKSESFHLIHGSLCVVLFKDASSQVLETIYLEAGTSNCFYRLNTSIYHLVIPLSEYVIMHETTPGPFVPNETEIAEWSLTEEGASLVSSIRSLVK